MGELQKYSIAKHPEIRVLGRTTDAREPLTLFWTASGLEMVYTGSELAVEFYADYDIYEPWISVELNGAWIARFPLNNGTNRFTIFRNMTPGRKNHVRILRDVQANEHQIVQVNALFGADGEFLPLPEPKCRLEFIGDSITSGEGAIGAIPEEDWIMTLFSAENCYARMTADALGAEYRSLSRSGWGTVASWDNNPHNALPPYYTQVCGVVGDSASVALGAGQEHDFSSWQPDAVIVNLGTNDSGAFANEGWKDEATGESFKLRMNEDGSYNAEDMELLRRTTTDFLRMLRKNNPNALLVWVYGMLGDPMRPALEAGVEAFRRESGDERAHFLMLPNTTDETVGAKGHPGVAAHRAAAEVLTAFLQQQLA